MLSAQYDIPIIRQAIYNKLETLPHARLGEEPTIHVVEDEDPPHIRVGIRLQIDEGNLYVESIFHLPLSFELRQVHNEIDEIAENVKEARLSYWRNGRPAHTGRVKLRGTGLRGRWP